MSVYRRGAIYWWARRVKLDADDPRSIMLRISLKTSDKAEARSRALALDTELKMVALRYPKQRPAPAPEQLQAVFKEALEFKRDQIAAVQSRPPYDYEEHRLVNGAMARVCDLLARSGGSPVSATQWDRAIEDPSQSPQERRLFEIIASQYGLSPHCAPDDVVALDTFEVDRIVPSGPRAQYPVAPRLVLNALANAGMADSADNRRMVLSTMAFAYRQAFLNANCELESGDANSSHDHLPAALQTLLKPRAFTPSSATIDQPCRAEHQSSVDTEGLNDGAEEVRARKSAANSGLIDLKMSELVKLAVDTHAKSGDWQDSAQRNAKVIADIFVAVNGDLRMSQIETFHLFALRDRLDRMPTIWGKSAEDRVGGFPGIFARGEALAAEWKADLTRAKAASLATVGFSKPTFNRHVLTLKQLFDFAADRRDGAGHRTHLAPDASFKGMPRKDKRKKNTRKPVPTMEEMRTLLSGPVHTGCAGQGLRFLPGSVVIHDSFYWVPLLLAIYGNRSNEFCQLPLEHVVDAAPLPFFRILEWEGQKVKTAATNRNLPIAPLLIHLGFLEYVKALRERGEFWLFPELNFTREPPRKVFLDDVFRPLVTSLFPNGTSARVGTKDIDTQSMRKFATNYLLGATPKIELRIRQAYIGHERSTTIDSVYEADPTIEELFPCVLRMQELIKHLAHYPLQLRA